MDNSQLEKEAESLISSRLQKGGILVAKPSFDIQGSDLLAFVHLDDNARFCRVQCKGRSVENGDSNINVPADYVTRSFILFVYLKDGIYENENLYCFFSEDIRESWKISKNGKEYIIHIPRASFDKKLSSFKITSERMKSIAQRIALSDIDVEFSRFLGGGAGRKIVGTYLKLEDEFSKLIGKMSKVVEVNFVGNAPIDIISADSSGNRTAYRLLVFKEAFGMMWDIGTTLEEVEKYYDNKDISCLVIVLFFWQPNYFITERLFQAQYSRRYRPFYVWQYGVEIEDGVQPKLSFEKRADFLIDSSYWDTPRAKEYNAMLEEQRRRIREEGNLVLSKAVISESSKRSD